jgi:hypothetical protein
MRRAAGVSTVGPVMYARAVEDAAGRLRELRVEEVGQLVLAGVVLVLAVLMTWVHPPLSIPLLVAGVVVGAAGVRALWQRWDLVERLAGERDAYVIPEVLAYASREVTMDRRRSFAALIRLDSGRAAESDAPAVDELEALARELEDETLALDPVCGVACLRFVSDVTESPLLNPELPVDELRRCVRQIRSGFSARRLAA